MSQKAASSPLAPDSSSSSHSVPTEELKSLIQDSHVALERIKVDNNGNVAKSSQIVHIDSDDDFVNDEEVRNTNYFLIFCSRHWNQRYHMVSTCTVVQPCMCSLTNGRIDWEHLTLICSSSILFGPAPSKRGPLDGTPWTGRLMCWTPSAVRSPLPQRR